MKAVGVTKKSQCRLDAAGFGINIIGGSDQPYIPGHDGIFVSRIRWLQMVGLHARDRHFRPDTPAALDGRLQVGDRIRSVNGVSLEHASREEALDAFRAADDMCTLVIEPDAERKILSRPSDLLISPHGASSTRTARSPRHRSRPSSRQSSSIELSSRPSRTRQQSPE